MSKVNSKKVVLLIPDMLTARVFFDCNIVEKLVLLYPGRLVVLTELPLENFSKWRKDTPDVSFLSCKDSLVKIPFFYKVKQVLDRVIDERFGFFPLAIRFNEKYGFHTTRMCRGHKNWFLDSDRKGLLPDIELSYKIMGRWLFSRFRYIDYKVKQFFAENVCSIIISNLQYPSTTNYLAIARRLNIPLVGYVASWDHPVGKGIVAPFCEKYIVQNKTMRSDLEKYHSIEKDSIVVTGWPQADHYANKQPVEKYNNLLADYGLNTSEPTVLITGNTVTNAPDELLVIEKIVNYLKNSYGFSKCNLIIRPHPKDKERVKVYRQLMHEPGCFVQEPSYTDISELSLLLQHVSCVVTNAGTILLDSLANNRPVVCILYDENGSNDDECYAEKNISGDHYKKLMESGSFYSAYSFNEAIVSIRSCIDNPTELEKARQDICYEIHGEIDGNSSARVVSAIDSVVRKYL